MDQLFNNHETILVKIDKKNKKKNTAALEDDFEAAKKYRD